MTNSSSEKPFAKKTLTNLILSRAHFHKETTTPV
jgi:hypothetical protein